MSSSSSRSINSGSRRAAFHHPRNIRLLAWIIALSAILLAGTADLRAQANCPADWYSGISFPTTEWLAYTALGVDMEDEASGTDGSYGTSATPDVVDIFNGEAPAVPPYLPSLYYYFDTTNDILFYRQRLRGDPRQNAASGNTNYKQYTWTVNFDTDGDGYSDFLIQVNGFDDVVQVLYDADDDNLYNDALCTDPTPGDIVFQEDVALCTQITDSSATGEGYLLDWMLPLCALSDCSAVQQLDADTPFSMTFTTSTNPSNPTLKDLGFPGDYAVGNGGGTVPLGGGDACTLNGGCTGRPFVTGREADCTSLTAVVLRVYVMDTLVVSGSPGVIVDTIHDVAFQYRVQGSTTWNDIATASSPDAGTVNAWSVTWDAQTAGVPTDQVIEIKATVTDEDATGSPDNVIGDIFQIDSLSSCVVSLLPVSLAWVDAAAGDGWTRVEWATATEAGNLGFNLWGDAGSGWKPLNSELIASPQTDATAPQWYTYTASGGWNEVLVEAVDIFGRSSFKGPFTVGQAHGREPSPLPVDWAPVRAGLSQAVSADVVPAAAVRGADLLVDRTGIHRVRHEELAAAGVDLSGVPADALSLTCGGAPVPIRVDRNPGAGTADKRFGSGWFIEFFGEKLETLYTSTNVYRLTVDPALARRVRREPAGPGGKGQDPAPWYMETARVERDLKYSFSAPNGDPWYDSRLLAYTSPESWTFEVEVADLVAGAAPATLTVDLWGWTDFEAHPDHHVRVLFNGVAAAERIFDGLVQMPVTVELPEGLVHEGPNTLEIQLPGDTGVPYDLVALDGFSLTYPRAFTAREDTLSFVSDGRMIDVSGFSSPDVTVYRLDADGPVLLEARALPGRPAAGHTVRISGDGTTAQYALTAAAAILVPGISPARPAADIAAGEADYLVISHPLFLDGLGGLTSAREIQGLRVRVVDVRDVYDRFGHGIFGAEAIRRYIRHAGSAMGVRYVLLVGGDTYDYHDHMGLGSVSFIPSPYAPTHKLVKFAPVDTLYGDVDGDQVPDISVGRLPVRSTEELAAVVAKTLAYEEKTYGQSALFAADLQDGLFSFSSMSDSLAAGLGDGWSLSRAYMDDLGVDGARSALVDGIEGGAALTVFVGHSGPTLWSFQSLFTAADAASLANYGKPTVVNQWGCWNTYHVSPEDTSMAEALLLSGEQGAAAVLGAATLTSASSDKRLGDLLTPMLGRPGVRLGDAMLAAKRKLALTDPDALDVLLGWTLLGDPALEVVPR